MRRKVGGIIYIGIWNWTRIPERLILLIFLFRACELMPCLALLNV